MEQRVSVITLGVADRRRARSFYEALGWTSNSDSEGEDPDFFQAGGLILALWDRGKLAEDSEVTDGGGWGGVTFAHCVDSPEEVERVTEQARAAGGTIAREPAETFWGGYDSIVIDPDGHPWEIAHNPSWTINPDGSVALPSD